MPGRIGFHIGYAIGASSSRKIPLLRDMITLACTVLLNRKHSHPAADLPTSFVVGSKLGIQNVSKPSTPLLNFGADVFEATAISTYSIQM